MEVAFEMVEETFLFLEFVGVILEEVLLGDVLFVYLFDIAKAVFPEGEYLSGVIEVDPDAAVAEGVADAVLGRVVDPLLDGDVGEGLECSPLGVELVFVVVAGKVLEHPLALGPLDVALRVVALDRELVDGGGAVSRQEAVVALAPRSVLAGELHKPKFTISLLV